jgi:antibiotic biosynthesis monooxygenase (ABM) superfamily enzyme
MLILVQNSPNLHFLDHGNIVCSSGDNPGRGGLKEYVQCTTLPYWLMTAVPWQALYRSVVAISLYQTPYHEMFNFAI